MFVEGGVPLDVPVESLAVASPVAPQEALKGGKVPPLYYGTRRDQAWECSSSFKKKKKLKTIFPESEKIIVTLQHIFIIHKKPTKLHIFIIHKKPQNFP